MFREFFTEGFAYLDTRARGVACFVMNECGNFSEKPLLISTQGQEGSVFRNEWVWEFFTEGFAYLINFNKGYQFRN